MLTFYHAPLSRSTRILSLIEELGNSPEIEIVEVDIHRTFQGFGARDPRNPHPEGKVPLLVHDGVEIWETSAIALYLTGLYPQSGLGVGPGDPARGRFLSWMFWYAGVVEPVVILHLCQIEHPMVSGSWRGLPEICDRLETALAAGPWLMGDHFTTTDLMLHSAFVWAPQILPDSPAIRDWVERCRTRPAALRARARDEAAMAALMAKASAA
ncbi:MAG: glutathione S-transferase [Rhodobacteraceae bacterium]|nr:glutathione S-transferase [Paracoccaceae bacterium]